MSKYCETETKINDARHLATALESMGFTIEVHEKAVALFGYQGDEREEKANVIIRRAHTGLPASNDVGFVREANGTYRAIISQYDQQKFDAAWLGSLKQNFQESRTMAMARAKGYQFQGREVIQTAKGQTIKLLFGVR